MISATNPEPEPASGRRMNVYIGTSGFAYPKWKGSFYPSDLPAKQMLQYYSERFQAVEINSTFQRMPTVAILGGWASDVPADFKFVLKAPQQITHWKRLKDVADPVAQFLEVAKTLKRRLGPLFFQLPPNFKKDSSRLRDVLALLPSRRPAAFEFRHPSWFDDEVFGLLRKHRAALCIADAEGDLKVPFVPTADWGYLRLRRLNYGKTQLQVWSNRIQTQDWREVFVFFRHEDKGNGPRLAKRLLALLE